MSAQMIPPAPAPSPLKAGITLDFMAKTAPSLARDIVLQLDSAHALAAAYGLSPEQWDVLRVAPAFRKMVEAAMSDLSGSKGLDEKIKLQSQMALANGGVLDLAVMASNPAVPFSVRKGCHELLGEFAGVGAKAKQSSMGAGYSGPLIRIFLPGSAGTISVGNSQPVIEGEVL